MPSNEILFHNKKYINFNMLCDKPRDVIIRSYLEFKEITDRGVT